MAKRMIVIDDQIDIRNAFQLALENTGIQVDTAASGAAGLEKIRANQYDLVCLDLKMPGMNGVETLQAIREMDRDLPVYIITAFQKDFLDDLKAVQRKGYAFEVMQKPLGMPEIRQIASALLQEPSALGERRPS